MISKCELKVEVEVYFKGKVLLNTSFFLKQPII